MGTNLNLSRTHTNNSVRSELALANGGTVLGVLSQIPTVPVYGPTGAYGVNPFNQSDNPVGNLLETSNLANVYQVVGNLYAEFDVLKNLKARTSVGLDFTSQNENQYISTNYPGTSNADASVRGRAQVGNTLVPIWLLENTLTYTPSLGEQHHLTLLAGQSMQASDRVTSGATTQGFPNNGTPYLSGGSAVVGIPYSYEEQWSLISYFARATYDYEGRYLAQISARADGTSRFSTQQPLRLLPGREPGLEHCQGVVFPAGHAPHHRQAAGQLRGQWQPGNLPLPALHALLNGHQLPGHRRGHRGRHYPDRHRQQPAEVGNHLPV